MSSRTPYGQSTFILALLGWILAEVSDSWIETMFAVVTASVISFLFAGIESGIHRKKNKEKL